MFERQQELERAQGYRGPAIRFFGSLDDPEEARRVIKDMCITLLCLAAVIMASSRRAGVFAIALGLLVAVPSCLLLLSRSRAAAVTLLVGVAVAAVGALIFTRVAGIVPLLFWGAALLVAQRASAATFKARRSVKAQTS